MKILLLNPPNFRGSYTNRDLMGGLGVNNIVQRRDGILRQFIGRAKARAIRIPVLSLVYSATILSKDHDVTVLDAANLDLTESEIQNRAIAFQPDWIISATSISTIELELKLLAQIKKHTGAKVAVIGDSASLCSDEWITENKIDFVVVGDEPELAMYALAQTGTLKSVAGVSQEVNGRFHKSTSPAAITQLDDLPIPRWDLFPFEEYRYFPMLRRRPFVTAQASRGCPYGCIYCPYTSNQGLKYRYRSAESVFREIIHLKDNYGVESIQFRDPTFTLRKERITDLCNLIISNNIQIELGCETRIDCLNESLIDKMVEAGFRGVNVGIESTDPQVIRNAKRGWISPDLMERNVSHMRKNGIRVAGFFVLGLPGENRQTIEQTIAFSKKLELSYAEFKIATPFPGTPLLEMALQNQWVDEVKPEDYSSYTATMKVHPDLTQSYLEKTLSLAYRRFYVHPPRIIGELFSDRFLRHMFALFVGPAKTTKRRVAPHFGIASPNETLESRKAA